MKPFHTLLASVVALFFLLGFTAQTIAPQLKRYLIIKLEEKSRQHSPISILANDISIDLFPLSISVDGIKTKINPLEVPNIKTLRLGSLRLEIDVLSLLAGQMTLGHLKLVKLDALIIQDKKTKRKKNTLSENANNNDDAEKFDLFALLKKIPIKKIDLLESKIRIETSETQKSAKRSIEIKNLDVELYNDFDAILAGLKTPSIRIKLGNKVFGPLDLQLEAHLDQNSLNLSSLHMKMDKLNIKIHGNVSHQNLKFTNPAGTVESEIDVDLPQLSNLLALWTGESIGLTGQVTSKINTQFEGSKIFSLNSKNQARSLVIEGISIGDLDLATSYIGDKFKVDTFKWNGIGISAFFDKTALDLKNGRFTLRANVEKFDLPVFLDAIKVSGVPVTLDIAGKFECAGKTLPYLRAGCHGNLNLGNLLVKPRREDKLKIIEIDKGRVAGKFTATLDSVKYQAKLGLTHKKGDTEITSDGEIIYDKGFKINYKTSSLNLFHVKKLVAMKLEGFAAVEGSTQGDAEDATISMNVSTQDFYLGDYLLGNVNTKMDFAARTLNFTGLNANIGRSRYRGFVVVDLDKNTIRSDISMPFFETANVVKAIERHIPVPFGLTGAGQGTLSFAGPLQFNQLSYQLKTNISKGTMAGDSYDRIVLYISAKDGYVNVDVGELTKNESLIELKGTMNPEFIIDAQIQSDKMLIQESEWVSNITSSVTGEAGFFSELKGPVHAPTIVFKGTMKNVAFSDEPVPDSTIGFRFGDETLSGVANVLGNRVKVQFTFPLSERAPFRLVGETNDWDFGSLFAILGGERFRGEYDTKLTSEFNLVASVGGVWNSTGIVKIDEFQMTRGSQALANKKPMHMSFSRGKINIKDFELQGGENLLRVEGRNFSKNKLNIGINGRTDLRLMHLFVPFLEEIGGPASFAFKIGGSADRPQILGSAFVEKAYTKLFDIPHPFESIRSDITFSQSRILVNSMTADFAKGKVQASGQIDLVGLSNIPVNVNGTATNIEIEIPANVKTKGNAKLRFHGDWFPYTLSGVYKITGGDVTMEFDASAAGSIKKSSMLPKILVENEFEPILLDIKTEIPEKLKITNAYIDGYVTGELTIKDSPISPILLGVIDVAPESILKVRENKFDVKTAKIQFKNEEEINPELFVNAETQKNNYQIDLLLQGTALSPELKLTSQPPLDEASIISLLAFGTINTAEGTTSNTSINQSVSILPFGQELEDQLGVNIDLSTNFDENSAVDGQTFRLSQDLSEKASWSFASSSSSKKKSDEAEIRYKLNDRVSGLIRGENSSSTDGSGANEEGSILGVDLEYKVEFK